MARKVNKTASKLFEDADKYLHESLDLSRDNHPVLYIDTCDDLAQFYYIQDDLCGARIGCVKPKIEFRRLINFGMRRAFRQLLPKILWKNISTRWEKSN